MTNKITIGAYVIGSLLIIMSKEILYQMLGIAIIIIGGYLKKEKNEKNK